MIIKVKTSKKPVFRRLLAYMLKGSTSFKKRGLVPFVITHNIRGTDSSAWEQSFHMNEESRTNRRHDSTILSHEMISFHKDDNNALSEGILYDIAHEYIRQRGEGGCYVGIPHYDKDHIHIHFCVSGVEYGTGKSMRLSKGDFAKLKNNMQTYQIEKFPELTQSIVGHGRGGEYSSDRSYWADKRGNTKKQAMKRQINDAINKCRDFSDLQKELARQNITIYNRGGKPAGVIVEGKKYRWRTLGLSFENFQELFKHRGR